MLFRSAEAYTPSKESLLHCELHTTKSQWFVGIMSLFPLLMTTFMLIPTYLNVYAYQKAILGSHTDGCCTSFCCHSGSKGWTRTRHDRAKKHNVERHRNTSHDGHDDHHDDHHDHHGGGTGGCCCNRQCIVDTLVGKDTTSFTILIKDVCDVLKTTR